MLKKTLVLILICLLLPKVALAWTYRAHFNQEFPVGGSSIYGVGDSVACINRGSPTGTSYAESVVDSTTPDPARSLHMFLQGNMVDGGEPAHCWLPNFPSGTNEIWEQFYFKVSKDFVWHPTVSKLLYTYGTNTLCGAGGNQGERVPRVDAGVVSSGDFTVFFGGAIANGPPGVPGNYLFQNTGPSGAGHIEKGVWYKVKVHYYFGNPPGAYNSIIEVWINDVKIMDYRQPTYAFRMLSVCDEYVHSTSITPVWGGANNVYTPSYGLHWWFDDWTVSSGPISGGPIPIDFQNKTPNPPGNIRMN